MGTTIDWNEAAVALKREVADNGGFLTISKDAFRERFGITRLKRNNSEDLRRILEEHHMVVFPHPHQAESWLRVYDADSEIGQIAKAVAFPEERTDRALRDAAYHHQRADEGKRKRSFGVSWLTALEVFLQLVIGKPPEGWEDLDDERESYQLLEDLAKNLDLAADIVQVEETKRVAAAVCACRPCISRWESPPPALGTALAEAARKQKDIFDGVLREAAKHLLGGGEVPSRDVDLGRLGLRYRREAQGGVGWLR